MQAMSLLVDDREAAAFRAYLATDAWASSGKAGVGPVLASVMAPAGSLGKRKATAATAHKRSKDAIDARAKADELSKKAEKAKKKAKKALERAVDALKVEMEAKASEGPPPEPVCKIVLDSTSGVEQSRFFRAVSEWTQTNTVLEGVDAGEIMEDLREHKRRNGISVANLLEVINMTDKNASSFAHHFATTTAEKAMVSQAIASASAEEQGFMAMVTRSANGASRQLGHCNVRSFEQLEDIAMSMYSVGMSIIDEIAEQEDPFCKQLSTALFAVVDATTPNPKQKIGRPRLTVCKAKKSIT